MESKPDQKAISYNLQKETKLHFFININQIKDVNEKLMKLLKIGKKRVLKKVPLI